MPQPKRLKLVNDDPIITRADIEMARIQQEHREWHGTNGQPWQPFREAQRRPTLNPDDVVSYKQVDPEPAESWPKVIIGGLIALGALVVVALWILSQ